VGARDRRGVLKEPFSLDEGAFQTFVEDFVAASAKGEFDTFWSAVS